MKTAIEALSDEVRRIQAAQDECLSESGHVLNHCKYKYSLLVKQAKEIKSALDWMNKMYA